MDIEAKWEKRLGISTGAALYGKKDANHSPYEPTAYAVLQRLADSGYIGRENTLVDYGCGKGRVGFFMNYATGCGAVGVEYDETLYHAALSNLASFSGRDGRVSFALENAENYAPGAADRFYFFNPFSAVLLDGVLRRILESYYENPRDMLLFFYYATDAYLSRLMTDPRLAYAGEIDCRDLFFNDDPRERILAFRVEG